MSGGGPLAAEAEGSILAEAVDRVAHQLKNPLQAMTVNLEVIRMRAEAADPGEIGRLADVVDDNIRRVDRRIRMLVALARRSPEESATSVDVGELLREAEEAFRLGEGRDGPGLRVRLPDGAAAGRGELAARAREGGLLALVVAAASRAAAARLSSGDGERPYLAAGRGEEGTWIEVGPGTPWGSTRERDQFVEQVRLAGGELAAGQDDPPSSRGPVRVVFPRA